VPEELGCVAPPEGEEGEEGEEVNFLGCFFLEPLRRGGGLPGGGPGVWGEEGEEEVVLTLPFWTLVCVDEGKAMEMSCARVTNTSGTRVCGCCMRNGVECDCHHPTSGSQSLFGVVHTLDRSINASVVIKTGLAQKRMVRKYTNNNSDIF
jgi:hypothetical protein